MERVNILWTGGWDSTYQVLRLMEKPVSIQPYYLIDKNRRSKALELKAIRAITEDIRNHPATRCELLDIITVNTSDIPADAGISNAYQNIRKTNFFGSQYDWLARFASLHQHLELNLHKDDTANFFRKHGNLIRITDGLTGGYHLLDPEGSSEDLVKVFGNFRFPILNTTKLEMKAWAEDKGLLGVMNKTWFCHKPVKDEPCGQCSPCNYAMDEGMGYRFSKAGLRRYRLRKFFIRLKQAPVIRSARKMIKRFRNN